MATNEQIQIIIKAMASQAIGELNKLNTGLGQTEKSSNSVIASLAKYKYALLAATTAVIAFGVKCVSSAMNAEESMSKFFTIFGSEAESVGEWADDLGERIGRSSLSLKGMAADAMALVNPLSASRTAAIRMSQGLVQMAQDLSSFNNVSVEEAFTALRSGISGEAEPMKRFGVLLTDAAMGEYALSQGIRTRVQDMSTAERTQLRYNLMLHSMGVASGDAERTSGSLTNRLRALGDALSEGAASIGSEMLPGITDLINELYITARAGGPVADIIHSIGRAAGTAAAQLAELIRYLRDSEQWIRGQVQSQSRTDGTRSEYQGFADQLQAMNFATMQSNQLQQVQADLANSLGATGDQARYLNNMMSLVDARLNDANRSGNTVAAGGLRNLYNQMQRLQTAMGTNRPSTGGASTVGSGGSSAAIRQAQREAEEIAKLNQQNYDRMAVANAQYNDRINGTNTAAFVQLENNYRKDLEAATQHGASLTDIHSFYALERDRLEDELFQKNMSRTSEALSFAGQQWSQMGNIVGQYFKNQNLKLDIWYKNQKKAIESSTKDEETKKAELAALDEQYAKKQRDMAIKQAKYEKANAIITALINTSIGVTNALGKSGTPWTGIAMAAIIGALGAAQVAMIASQPIPEAAEGGLITGSQAGTLLRAGEGGRSEAIIPLENPAAMERLGGMGSTVVNIHFDRMWASTSMPGEVASAVDRALYDLRRRGNSRFATAIEG